MSFDKIIRQSLIWRGFYFLTVFMLNIALSQNLQAEGSGFVYYLSNFFAIVLLMASISMDSSLAYYSASDQINHKKLANFAFVFTAILCAVLFAFLPAYFTRFEKGLVISKEEYSRYGLFCITGLLLINFFTGLFYAKKNFFLPNVLMSVLNIVLIVLIWNNKNSHQTITQQYFLFVLLQGLTIMLAYFLSNKVFSFTFPSVAEIRWLFKYATLAVMGNLIFFLVYRIDYWFVKYNCSANDLGNYIQVSKLGQMFWMIPQIIASAVFPQIANGKLREEVSSAMIKLSRLFIQVFMVVIIVTAITGKWIFPFLLGSSFTKVQLPLLLLLPGILSLSILCLLSAYFGGRNKISINVKGALLALIVVIAGNCIFFKWYSIYVAAIASTIGYTVNLLFSLRLFLKYEKINLKNFFVVIKSDWVWLKQVLFAR